MNDKLEAHLNEIHVGLLPIGPLNAYEYLQLIELPSILAFLRCNESKTFMNWRVCKNHDYALTKPAECIESICLLAVKTKPIRDIRITKKSVGRMIFNNFYTLSTPKFN